MHALSNNPKIVSLSHALGIHEGDRVESILEYCRSKVRKLLKGAPPIRSIDDLERFICEKLHITIIEVHSEGDIDKVIEKYARQEKEPAFSWIRQELTNETFATLLQLKRRAGETHFRYVAVIDCRGNKSARRFFSKWHEIAHVLTTVSQLQMPLHRSTVKKDPTEKMLDLIAGEIGFYSPLFSPILEKECASQKGLTFSAAENVRRAFCEIASMEATMNACAARLPQPIILLQAKMGYKKAEQRAMESGQDELFPAEKPVAHLRIASVVPNAAARHQGLMIPMNMKVPIACVIMKAFQTEGDFQSICAGENLNWWRSSDGKALRHTPVRVEAIKVGDRVWAIMRFL